MLPLSQIPGRDRTLVFEEEKEEEKAPIVQIVRKFTSLLEIILSNHVTIIVVINNAILAKFVRELE